MPLSRKLLVSITALLAPAVVVAVGRCAVPIQVDVDAAAEVKARPNQAQPVVLHR